MYAGLIKLGQKEHMQDLYRRGHLYLNTFDFFRQLEIDADGRGDPDEYISEYYCGPAMAGLKIGLKIQKVDKTVQTLELTPETGLAEFKTDYGQKTYSHLFCASLMVVEDIRKTGQLIAPCNIAANKDWMIIIYDVREFLNRIKTACEYAGWGPIEARPVEYFDASNYGGAVGCFKKSNVYKHQVEWRLAVSCPNTTEAQSLFLGSLEGIATEPFLAIDAFKEPVIIGENQ